MIKAYSSTRALHGVQSQIDRTSQALASGKRINSAADDAAGLAIARKLEGQEVSLSQAGRNLADASSFVRVADGGLSEASSIVTRLRELAIEASNGTLSDGQRTTLQQEAGALSEELGRIEQTTEFNGTRVFEDGVSLDVQAGDDAGETIAIDPGGSFVAPLGLDGIDLSTVDGAREALGVLDAASENISSRQAELGATDNRFRVAGNEVASSREALVAARSRIEDADIAETTARSVAERIRSQAAVAVHGQANFTTSLLGSLYEGIG